MKTGICSTDFAPCAVDDLFRKIRGYGFDAVQFSWVSIGLDEIPSEIDDEVIDNLKAAAEKNSVEIAAINATFNLIDHDKNRLHQCIKNMEVVCAAAKKLECNLLTLCTGSRSRVSMWTWDPATDLPDAYEELKQNLRPVIETADKYGMYLGMETEASNVINTPEKAVRLIADMGYERLGIILDCANLFPAGTARKENVRPVISHAFDLLGDHIILAHGKDIADSDGVEFAPVGKGIVDYDLFLTLLKKYGYDGPMILHGIYDEQQMPESVSFFNRIFKKYNQGEG